MSFVRARRGAAALVMLILLAGSAAAGCSKGAGKALDIVAVAVDVLGPDPFFETAVGEDQRVSESGPNGGIRTGDLAGLYGGSLNKKTCDKDLLISFLSDRKNERKAKAWAGIRGIKVKDIPGYVRKLTPVLLRNDTLVKNHGFRDGVKTVFEALLEAGIAVLVDDQGEPVVKCNCGNPLAASTHTPADLDADALADLIPDVEWRKRSSPKKVTVIRPSKSKRVHRFHLVNVTSGQGIGRPAGTDSSRDVQLPAPPAPPEQDPIESVAPTIVGTWKSPPPLTSLVRVDPAGGDELIGVLAEDLPLKDGCVLPAGKTMWRLRGTGPTYTGTIAAVDVTTCADLPEVSATWELTGDDTLTLCPNLEQVSCTTLTRQT